MEIANKIILRPYQEDFIARLSRAFSRTNRRILAVAPTGSGKTKMFITIAQRAMEKGRPVVIITEALKIFDQITKEAGGIEIANGIKHVHIRPGHLYIAMAQTLSKRPLIVQQLNTIEPPPLIIIDEAHIGQTSKILGKLNEDGAAMVLGFTATPDARVAKHLPDTYSDCVVCCQVDDLIQQGFLCNYRHHARTKAGLDVLEIRNGEYTEESQNKAFNTSEVYDGIFEDLNKFNFKKAMVFVASIAHAEEMYDRLQDAGFASTRYHSQLENASYELAKFTELGMADICVSVASLTKGFDFPPIDLVILNRATTSLPLYLQMIGRASRPTETKKFFNVLDYGGNWQRHGLYFEDREWEKLWKKTKKSRGEGQGVAPVSLCPKCESIIPASIRICPYCEYELPRSEKELAQGELIEVTRQYSPLIGKKLSELTPQELAVYAKIKNKQAFAARVARAMHQLKPSQGVIYEFAAAMGYKPSWADFQIRMIPATKIDFIDLTLR
jgi:superfamily II DNA or RNA helicase